MGGKAAVPVVFLHPPHTGKGLVPLVWENLPCWMTSLELLIFPSMILPYKHSAPLLHGKTAPFCHSNGTNPQYNIQCSTGTHLVCFNIPAWVKMNNLTHCASHRCHVVGLVAWQACIGVVFGHGMLPWCVVVVESAVEWARKAPGSKYCPSKTSPVRRPSMIRKSNPDQPKPGCTTHPTAKHKSQHKYKSIMIFTSQLHSPLVYCLIGGLLCVCVYVCA